MRPEVMRDSIKAKGNNMKRKRLYYIKSAAPLSHSSHKSHSSYSPHQALGTNSLCARLVPLCG